MSNKHNKPNNKKIPKNPKFNTELCDDQMTFEECELTILRHAVDESTDIQGKVAVDNEDIRKMILILENFLIRKKCICYGGTAINNILPKDVQFYNKDIEIPDYDFFSKDALADAKELANIYFSEGFTDVEAKSGVHQGTYKVFVNFIPIADITHMVEEIYDNLAKESITILGIKYCPPNYLRMSMYLELSRPSGDVSRWEKVFKRLKLLNKYHPLKPEIDCKKVKNIDSAINPEIFNIIRESFIEQGVVFFGGYAVNLYSNYMPESVKRIINRIPEYDVLVENYDKCALIVKERLEEVGIKKVKTIEHEGISDIIPRHTEIQVDGKAYSFIYEPIACHNYNVVEINNYKVNIATIDTMLSFYLAFMYLNNKYYNKERILCLAKYLYEVEQHNRLEQTNILKRFSTKCIGKQHGLSDVRAEKAEMFKKLENKRNTKEYEEWFLKYVPSQLSAKEQEKIKKTVEKYAVTYKKDYQKETDLHIKQRYDIKSEFKKSRRKLGLKKYNFGNYKKEDIYMEHKNLFNDDDTKDFTNKSAFHIKKDNIEEKKYTKKSNGYNTLFKKRNKTFKKGKKGKRYQKKNLTEENDYEKDGQGQEKETKSDKWFGLF